jgi:hypothetical protein
MISDHDHFFKTDDLDLNLDRFFGDDLDLIYDHF